MKHIRRIVLGLMLPFVAAPTLAETVVPEYQFSYVEPNSQTWNLERVEDEKKLVLNYSTQSKPKKEFSILVERADNQDVSREETLQEFRSRLPPSAEFSTPKQWAGGGGNGMLFQFRIPSQRSPLFAVAMISYKHGRMYNIVASKFCCNAAEDEELAKLIEGFRVD